MLYSSSSYSYHSVTNNPSSTFDRTIREKEYDLNDHLGNVTLVFSDWKLDLGSSSYTTQILATNNYYPFGMLMPGYTNSRTVSTYRYGYNDKEKDDDIKGVGNSYDFDARMLDTRLGRWLSLDPKAVYAAGWSPYRAFFCNPIRYTDPDGCLLCVGKDQFITKIGEIDETNIKGNSKDSQKSFMETIDKFKQEDKKNKKGTDIYVKFDKNENNKVKNAPKNNNT